MSITPLLVSSAALAAFVPIAAAARPSWLSRLISKFFTATAPPAPPSIAHENGWTFISCDDPGYFREWLGRDEEGFPFDTGESPSLGSHLLIELFDCRKESLKQEASVGRTMREAADESQATVVAESFHEFKPYGVSGAVIIQESHYTVHTWPEHGFAAVDLFYCGGTVHVHKAIDVLIERFQPSRMKFLVVRRGVQNEVVR